MDKKILLVIVIILIITAAFSGCIGSGGDGGGPKKPKFTEETAEYPAETGWLESGTQEARDDSGQIYVEVDSQFSIILNKTNVYSVTIDLSFDDFDDAHSGSDGNSPPDEVEVSLAIPGFNDTQNAQARTTPATFNFNLMGNKTGDMYESLPSEITFDVYAKCFSEITYPPSGRPSVINLYQRDNGVAYVVSASYQYYQQEGAETTPTNSTE